jgi:histidinol-phosphate aminotransferase
MRCAANCAPQQPGPETAARSDPLCAGRKIVGREVAEQADTQEGKLLFMDKSLHGFVPDWIRELAPYVPGKPIEEVERELGIRAVKLASNENPLGPSPRAMEAVRRYFFESNRYPDGGAFYLREKLAARHGVALENILVGDGSSELIDLAARILLGPESEGLTAEGTFPLYWIAIRAAGARLVKVPLKDYRFDLPAIAAAVTPRTRVIYLANPNNPTGTIFTRREFDEFYEQVSGRSRALIVLDEAYCDYVESAEYPQALARAGRAANLLVLRTFSKVYGMAGLRVGYGVGPAELLAEMNKLRTPFNTANVAQAAALAALDDTEHVQRSIAANREGRKQLQRGLEALGVQCIPSATNFLLVELGQCGQSVADALLHRGVIVRPMGWMGFPSAIRVSVGLREENEKFLSALAEVLREREGKMPAVVSP